MRVLYVITLAEFGGAQSHVLDLVRSAVQRGDTVGLAVGGRGPLSEAAQELGAEVMIIPELVQPVRPIKDCRALAAIRRALRLFHPDLVHAHSSKAGIVGRLAARLEGVPCLFTAHGWAFSEGVPLQRRVLALAGERMASRWCERIIMVSEYDRRLALRYRVAPPEQLVTIHNGVADTVFRADPGRAAPPVLLMVARFSPPKNQRELIRAVEGLSEEFKVEFVGEGPLMADLQAYVAEKGLAQRVTFWGARADVPRLLAEAQIFVLTSRWEGLPLTVLEAMRAGLPVVASNVGGVGEAVVDGETGFLVPSGDVAALRERLRFLILDPGLRARMGAAGRRRYEDHFTLEHMLKKTWEVYAEVVRPGGKPVQPIP